MHDLPAAWESVELGALVQRVEAGLNITCEERPPSDGERGLVKISAVTWGRFDERASKTLLPGAVVDERNRIRAGDLLISRANTIELVGAAVIVDQVERALYLSDKVLRLVVSEDAKRWINYALKSPALRKAIQEASSGNQLSMRNLSQEKLRGLRLPLAPLAEQQRIGDKLDAVVDRVDACRDRLARVAPLLKRFRQSVLDLAFSGRLTAEWRVMSQVQPTPPAAGDARIAGEHDVPDGWRVVRAEDVVQADANIVYGIVQPGPKLSEGVPYVQTMDIVDGCIQVQGLSMTSPEIAGNYQRSSLRGGDVLLGIIRATKVAVVPNELAGANISRSVARFRPRDGVLSRYLALALEAPVVQRWLRSQHRGIDMPVLNLAQVRQAPIRVAPVEEQAEIVRRVDVLFAFADRLEARLEKAQAAADRLTPALLAKAFRGELVPQDPADEPAAELLKRLTADRPAPAAKVRRPRAA